MIGRKLLFFNHILIAARIGSRFTAKNFKDVVIVASKEQYQPLLDLLNADGAETTLEKRKWFAEKAFGVSSHYDTAINAYFKKSLGE